MERHIADTQFPLGSPWDTTREMLYDVMTDLHREWVQDYLLRPDVLADAVVLSSPKQLLNSVSYTCMMYDGFDKSQLVLFLLQLVVPAKTVDDIAVGICVESYASEGSAARSMRRRDRFMHYVCNERTGARILLSVDDDANIVDMCFYRQEDLTSSVLLNLEFDKCLFLSALTTQSGRLDFEMLESSILKLFQGNAVHEPIYPVGCYCRRWSCVGCAVRKDGTLVSRNQRSFHKHIFIGDWFSNCTVRVYQKSGLGRRLIHSNFLTQNCSRVFGVAECGVKKMVDWGMGDRLCRLKPVPKPTLPFQGQNLAEEEELRTQPLCAGHKRQTATIARLVPAPTAVKKTVTPRSASAAFLEEWNKKQKEKELRRKIGKREAAARSNAKKSEAKRAARSALLNST